MIFSARSPTIHFFLIFFFRLKEVLPARFTIYRFFLRVLWTDLAPKIRVVVGGHFDKFPSGHYKMFWKSRHILDISTKIRTSQNVYDIWTKSFPYVLLPPPPYFGVWFQVPPQISIFFSHLECPEVYHTAFDGCWIISLWEFVLLEKHFNRILVFWSPPTAHWEWITFVILQFFFKNGITSHWLGTLNPINVLYEARNHL